MQLEIGLLRFVCKGRINVCLLLGRLLLNTSARIDPDFNKLKIFTLTLISKTMKVFTTTTTTTSLYDIPLFYY